jgi:hypothetical protein
VEPERLAASAPSAPSPRDAVRGGGPLRQRRRARGRPGLVNGLFYDPNALGAGKPRERPACCSGDIVRAGLAGIDRGYTMTLRDGSTRRSKDLVYPNQPAGYATQPVGGGELRREPRQPDALRQQRLRSCR